jgi:hypothetical protein
VGRLKTYAIAAGGAAILGAVIGALSLLFR